MAEVNLAPAEFMDLQAVLAGRYSLVREIGRGGMGIVLLARDVALERDVAIKLLPGHQARDDALRERFLREARTAAQLMHPNIVPIHIVEAHDDIVFFVMSLVDGETLAERVRRGGVLDAPDAIRVMQEVAWALGYAHGRGIVHRDIKPDNILLERGSGRALVADFGIARVANRATLSADGALMGTVQFMSPEQVGAEELDGRSDVYSLGATMYFALTGSSPVDGPTIPAMLARLMTETPAPVAHVRTDLPAHFASVVMRCLSRQREDRFATADELAGALHDVRPGTVVRPELRHFIRELHSAKMILVGGLLAAPLLAVLIGTEQVSASAWPAVLAIAIGTAYLFGVSLLGLLLTLARARVPRDEVETALTAELADVHDSAKAVPLTTRATARTLQGLGIASILFSSWSVWRWWQTMQMVPDAERSFTWYVPLVLYAAALVYGVVTLATVHVDRDLPRWLAPNQTGANPVNSWPLRLVRAIVRTRPVRWLFARERGEATATPAALPTATLLLNRVEELISQLPPAMQGRLADVVPVAAALERAIVELRARLTRIDVALAEIAAGSPVAREFTDARTRISARLEQCVSALESIRIDCLRLSAGLIAADGVTADLDKAQELSAIIDAELRGLDEVRRIGS